MFKKIISVKYVTDRKLLNEAVGWITMAKQNYCKKIFLLFLFILSGSFIVLPAFSKADSMENMMDKSYFLTETNTIADMVNHPALMDFGTHLLPRPQETQSRLLLRDVGKLMPWHSHIVPQVVLQAINRMITDSMAGKDIFYSFYQEQTKKDLTGLFYFRGKAGAPFALICPGGGFVYVGSLHEGFPLAEIIRQKGYNAFVLQYRTGDEMSACEDMAAALSWIFENAERLGVSSEGYSVWGGSAGARMAANLGSFGAAVFGGEDVPRPSAVIMAYTGHGRYTENDPPTFAVVSSDDPIASSFVMKKRIDCLKQAGIPTEFHLYHHAGHGFGTGKGTDAENWIDLAVQFWEKQINN